MVQVVYIDVLFAVNLIINYFMLLSVSRVLHRGDKRLRLLLGAAVGALYALFIFLPEMGLLNAAGLKALLSLAIVLSAFRWGGWRTLLRLLGVFYLVSFAFGGLVFACYLFFSPPGLLVRNGVVYIDVSPVALILLAGGCYTALTLAARLSRRHEAGFYQLSLTLDGCTVSFNALLDTGNTLRDPLSGLPVVVAECRALRPLLPRALAAAVETGDLGALPGLAAGAWKGRLRLVPFAEVSGGGLLPAFRPEMLAVRGKKKTVKTADVLIAVCKGHLSGDGRYHALLTPLLLQDERTGDDCFAGDNASVPVGGAPARGAGRNVPFG